MSLLGNLLGDGEVLTWCGPRRPDNVLLLAHDVRHVRDTFIVPPGSDVTSSPRDRLGVTRRVRCAPDISEVCVQVVVVVVGDREFFLSLFNAQ